ncbi:hypothetical protein [Chryseobacterium oryctis]|uniref:Lipoprotein n=1 Tax=Chryseobacterium oryctis TaxID=2952618 RepID=A0ABT3HLI3_9FLAO|nr:hypothetical protein [Chryseobacterium oryctis]MCW3160653.1 hypothetical protein [Chryseobacterium oryctis]
MKKLLYINIVIVLILCFISCQSQKEKEIFEKITIDDRLVYNDTFKLLSKYPELKLFNNEKIESPTRTAFIIQESGYFDGLFKTKKLHFEDYKCKATYKDDTIEISLNNNNGYFGNGVFVKIFNEKFIIKDINPKTLKGETKFINSKPIYQKLVLNKSSFQKNDSIYGFINYKSNIDSTVIKIFRGYFKTIIK